jgi:site-specific recombinase XerD
MRVLTVLDRYVQQLQADGRSPHTVAQVRRHVRVLDRWLGEDGRSRDVRRITHLDLAAFLTSDAATRRPDGQPKKATATNALRSSMRTLFNYVHAAGYAQRNAAALVRRAKCASPPPRAMSEADCKRLLATLAASDDEGARRDHLLFALLLATGIRIGSALALETRDVDLAAGEMTLRTTKGDRPDRVPLPRGLCRQIRAYLREQGDGPLFVGWGGRSMTSRHARRRLARWLRQAGIQRHASPHALRHTFAHRVYAQSGDLLATQRALRHRSLNSTAIYAVTAAGPRTS